MADQLDARCLQRPEAEVVAAAVTGGDRVRAETRGRAAGHLQGLLVEADLGEPPQGIVPAESADHRR